MNAPAIVHAPAADRRRLPKAVVAGGAALLIGTAGVAWIRAPATTESTDDAYLQADSTTVSARVPGTVVAMYVRDNQAVRAGDPLLKIDPEQTSAKLLVAQADVADADAAVASARAALTAFAADRRVARADVVVSGSAISAAEAEGRRAALDDARYRALAKDGYVSRRDAERVATAAADARSQLAQRRASLVATRERSAATDSRLAALQADLAKAEAAAERARAALQLARQDQGHTLVRAAIGGIIGNRRAQVGDLVQPGTQLLTIVPGRQLYVVANFKETQTRRMIVGQPAKVKVDALDGEALPGRVESLAPSSGSQFTLLPFEPGSGNFTKIVQRVPVRIALDRSAAGSRALRPGLSVTASVSMESPSNH